MKALRISRDSAGVAQVAMARAEVFNAFNEQMIAELDAAFAELGADPGIRVIVLAGEGKAFSAGADLEWLKRTSVASSESNLADARILAAMYARVESCPKPTIARVHGPAFGGGVGLVCACDIAVASHAATFALTEARLGILPSVIGPYVVNAVGRRNALRLALTASRIDAAEARAMGLVQNVVPPEQLDEAVANEVRALSAGGPRALAEIKTLFARLPVGELTPEVRELTTLTIARVRATPEAREGFAAFLGKRPPAWVSG
jgi:methylglutaconyl-CoA hydratase